MEARQKEIQAENEQAINRVLNTAIAKNGPVHLNLPFEEPLYDTTTDTTALNHNSPVEAAVQVDDFSAFSQRWHSSEKKMLLVGVLAPNSLDAALVDYLAADPSVTVLTETTSNLQHYTFIQSIDTLSHH